MPNHIDSEGRTHISTDRARGATKATTRYILPISLVLVVVLFAAIYFLV